MSDSLGINESVAVVKIPHSVVFDEYCVVNPSSCCQRELETCQGIRLPQELFVTLTGVEPPVGELDAPYSTYTSGILTDFNVMKNGSYRMRWACKVGDTHYYILADSEPVGIGDGGSYVNNAGSEYYATATGSPSSSEIHSGESLSTYDAYGWKLAGFSDTITLDSSGQWKGTIVHPTIGTSWELFVQTKKGTEIQTGTTSSSGTGGGPVLLSPTPYRFSADCYETCVNVSDGASSHGIIGPSSNYDGKLVSPEIISGGVSYGTSGWKWQDSKGVVAWDDTLLNMILLNHFPTLYNDQANAPIYSQCTFRSYGPFFDGDDSASYIPGIRQPAPGLSISWSYSLPGAGGYLDEGNGDYAYSSSGPGIIPSVKKQLVLAINCASTEISVKFVSYVVMQYYGKESESYSIFRHIHEDFGGGNVADQTFTFNGTLGLSYIRTVPWPFVNFGQVMDNANAAGSFPYWAQTFTISGVNVTVTISP